MSRESGTATFSTPSPSDVDVLDPNKRAKISYAREFLLSLDIADSIVKSPLEAQPLIPCVVDEAPGLLSSPLCAPDYKCQSVPQQLSPNVVDDVSQLLHRSDEPYRPPCRYKARTSIRDGNDSLNGDTSESSECTDQERADRETWRKDLEGIAHVKESLKKSMPPSFLSKDNCGNHKNHCEVAHEQGFMELQLSNSPVSVYYSPGKISTNDPLEAYISPTSVEKGKQFASLIDDCESSTVYCKGISVRMNQNPSCPDFQIHQELESESFSCSSDGESNSSFELCLPDEDSLITFDELFLMPDVENLTVFDSSMSSSPESNLIEADVFSPSSPREMVEKLVEFILNDEISTPHVDDPIVHHGAGLGRFSHSMHAQKTPPKFCSNQLNPERDPQDHDKFQRNSIDSAIYSFYSHSFPSNTFSQPLPLNHDELKRFDHEVSQSMLQQIINPGKLNLCSLQSGLTPNLPALQMASCTQKLNSMQTRPFAYQEPKNYGDFVKPSPDFQGDGNINPALVDSFIEEKLRSSHWHPHVQGF
ncbi:hypothetical protein JHK82_028983 [Glycine max]|nr:hypothetical protein JHK85_029640 [Glycine max]KAG5004958.1 hypothetical protein JHK86_029097 [Glycine max]KAG5128148.1 hypothetical protein JHK82_028983 [Glycine max]KAG5152751.1 hypothetical protein JHK84_029223 [Glycine max]